MIQQLAHQLQRITPCMSKCASAMRTSQFVWQMLSEEPRLMLQGSAGPVCGLENMRWHQKAVSCQGMQPSTLDLSRL